MNIISYDFAKLSSIEAFISVLWLVLWLIVFYALAFRRMHDINKTAWWLIATLPLDIGIFISSLYVEKAPIVFFGILIAYLIKEIFFLAWFCIESTPGENKYGPPSTALERK